MSFDDNNIPIFSPGTEGKFLYIRHGQTRYNAEEKNHTQEELKVRPDLLNCELSEVGIEQAKAGQSEVNKLKIEDAYVSPMTRALQTAYYLFENHPQREQIVFKVHPLITETVNGVHDLPYDTQAIKEKFNMNSKVKFDWSIFDQYYPSKRDQDLYVFGFIDGLKNDVKEKIFNEIYAAYGTDQLKEKVAKLAKVGIDEGLRRLESLKRMHQRAVEFKSFLKNKYRETMNNEENKVVCVTHSGFGRISTSKLAYTMSEIVAYPNDCYHMKNCEIISILI